MIGIVRGLTVEFHVAFSWRRCVRSTWFVLAVIATGGCVSLPEREQLASMPGPHATLAAANSLVDGRARFRDIFCAVLERDRAADPSLRSCSAWLWGLGDEPPAEHRPLPSPDLVPSVYLVTGAFSECLGEDARPFNASKTRLVDAGYDLSTIVVSGRSGSEHNARQIAETLGSSVKATDRPVVLIGYSKGANDILQFLVSYPELAARVGAVVSVAGAIGGTPIAAQAASIYDAMLDRIPSSRCAPGDGKVLDSLGVQARRDWLAANPLPRHLRYYSIAAFTTRERVSATLVPSWKLLLEHDPRSDGQLLARDSLIPGATLLGYADADHWSVAIEVEKVHPILGKRRDGVPFPRAALLEAILLQVAESAPRSAGRR